MIGEIHVYTGPLMCVASASRHLVGRLDRCLSATSYLRGHRSKVQVITDVRKPEWMPSSHPLYSSPAKPHSPCLIASATRLLNLPFRPVLGGPTHARAQ